MAKTVLIVDDSPTLRASVDFTLGEVGYRVLHAQNGKEALELLAQFDGNGEEIGMIITDVNMPVMDGISFIKEVKRTPFKFVPILVMTTEAQETMKNEGRTVGASGWLVKPFKPEQLLNVVAKLAS